VTTGRKSRLKRNLGGTVAQDDERFAEPFFDGPPQAELRTSITMPERLVRAVLQSEVERLSGDEDECRRIFSHIFDPTTSTAERDTYVANFLASPPLVRLGYPRDLADLPVFSIILMSDEEDEEVAPLANYVGTTLPEERPPGGVDQEYEGTFFTQMNSIFIYGQHPDQCLYLYQFAKLVLVGAREALHCAGMISPTYSGGELNPNEVYLPDNVFARVLNVHYKALMTVPKLFTYRDGRLLRVTGIFGKDIVVDGQRGGVVAYQETFGGDDDE
jgi:hypothetical protein